MLNSNNNHTNKENLKRKIDKTVERRVMQTKTYAQHQITSAQLVPQCQSPANLHPSLLLSMMPYGMEYPFGPLGSAVPAVFPPSFPCSPSLLTGGWGEEEKAWLCASSAQ